MRVGVDVAVHEHLVEIGAQQLAGGRRGVELGTAQSGDAGDVDTVDPVHHQQTRCHVIPQWLRHPQQRIAGQVPAETVEVLRFGPVVEFVEHRLAELGDPVGQAQAAAGIGQRVGGAGDLREHVKVAAHRGGHVGTLDLQRHHAAVMQDRPMHLRERGGGHRHRIDLGEHLAGAHAHLVLQQRLDVADRRRRGVVLDALECGDPACRHQVRTGRQCLAKLDEGRAHGFEVVDEALGQRVGLAVNGILFRRVAQVQAGHDPGAAIAREHGDDLRGTGKPLHGVVHVWSPLGYQPAPASAPESIPAPR